MLECLYQTLFVEALDWNKIWKESGQFFKLSLFVICINVQDMSILKYVSCVKVTNEMRKQNV